MKRFMQIFGTACFLVLAIGIGYQLNGVAQGNHVFEDSPNLNLAIPYSGRLLDKFGDMVADGSYDIKFSLFATEIGGEPQWSEFHKDISVIDGEFSTSLGTSNPLPQTIVEGEAHWLSINVRESGELAFTELNPRQRLIVKSNTPTLLATAPPMAAEMWS